jgi:hypothetical protein
MITNEKKIEKLEFLLSYAISKTDRFALELDRDETWELIDKIIKINDYIDKLKEAPAKE